MSGKNRLAGMTINERLGELGLFDEWDLAARAHDRAKMIKVMRRCYLTQEDAESTVDRILKNPTKYGC
jgi:hypothetical protein